MHFTYVLNLLENFHEIKGDYSAAPDSDIRLDLIDLEDAITDLLDEEEKEFVGLIMDGYSVPEIAKEQGTYERATYRKRKKIARKLAEYLEFEELE